MSNPAIDVATEALGAIVARMAQGEVPDPTALAAVLAQLEAARVAAGGFDKVLTAMQSVMEEVRGVPKRGHNSFHGYHYVLSSDLLAALQPACVRHGLVIVPSLEGEPKVDAHGNVVIVMNYRIAHVSGQVWPFPVRIPAAGADRDRNGKSGDKGVYKALTGAQKYMLQEVFQVPTGEDIDGGTDHDHPTRDADGDREPGDAGRGRKPTRGGYRRQPPPQREARERPPAPPTPQRTPEEAARTVNADEVDELRAIGAEKGLDGDKLVAFVRGRYRDVGDLPELTVAQRDHLVTKVFPNMAAPKALAAAAAGADEDCPV